VDKIFEVFLNNQYLLPSQSKNNVQIIKIEKSKDGGCREERHLVSKWVKI
jgi:hypothetical protein